MTMDTDVAGERPTYFIKAMQEGLASAMREDDRVVVIGEDVDRSVIGATRGLGREFGEERVRNTPISEQAFVGAAVGAAAVGLRPVVDMMIGAFFYVAMDQLANQAARSASRWASSPGPVRAAVARPSTPTTSSRC